MSIKAKLAAASNEAHAVGGFVLPQPRSIHFHNADGLHKALKEQESAFAVIDSEPLRAIDLDGTVGGTGYRLSRAAFGDLCHWSGTPTSFIKSLAKLNETLALDVVATQIAAVFHSNRPKSLVVDTRDNVIHGIVGSDTYAPISNLDAMEYALSAASDLILSSGWISGPNMRLAVISEKKHDARVGDVVRFGINLENSINGDSSLKVCDYAERLSCTNGAVARDRAHSTEIVHRGDVQHAAQKAICASALRAEEMLPMMRAAATHVMEVDEIKSFGAYVKDPKEGGSDSLWNAVRNGAMEEAENEGRNREMVTTWNMVNGITAAAHETKTIARRVELESMGYRALVKFGAHLVTGG